MKGVKMSEKRAQLSGFMIKYLNRLKENVRFYSYNFS